MAVRPEVSVDQILEVLPQDAVELVMAHLTIPSPGHQLSDGSLNPALAGDDLRGKLVPLVGQPDLFRAQGKLVEGLRILYKRFPGERELFVELVEEAVQGGVFADDEVQAVLASSSESE